MSKIDPTTDKNKPIPAPDADPGDFTSQVPTRKGVRKLSDLPRSIRDLSEEVGIDARQKCRAGSYFQVDHSAVFSRSGQAGLEVMAITDALERYDWLEDYFWSLVSPEADQYTKSAMTAPHGGYFIRALPGAKAHFPLQACLFMTRDGMAQNVHNIIIAEEGADLSILTGCVTGRSVRTGLHVGISEFYVKEGARISFTMIHNWAEGMVVRPRSAARIGEDGVFISNYFCIRPVRSLQMYPTALCAGRGAVARFNNVFLAPPGCTLDVGSRAVLGAEDCRAEILSRVATTGGDITARGQIAGEVPGVKAHLDCRGLILSPVGTIHAIPELVGKVRDVDISHEAAVGKIAEEEILYLMTRGLTAEEAVSAIVRGFLDVRIEGLPDSLRDDLDRAIGKAAGARM